MQAFRQILVRVFAVSLIAGTTFLGTGCGSGVELGAQKVALATDPSVVLAVRKNIQAALAYQITILGTDELKPSQDRASLESVAHKYLVSSDQVLVRLRAIPEFIDNTRRIESARNHDMGTPRIESPTLSGLIGVVAEYQNAFNAVSLDLDNRLGRGNRKPRFD